MDTGVYVLIGILAVGTAAAIGIGVGVHKIKRKLREVSREAFGTDDFVKGYKDKEYELSSTPQSVCGMTSVLLPSITRDFPEFNYNQAKSKSEAFIKEYLNSLEACNTQALKTDQISSSIINKVEGILNDLASQNKRVFYDNIVINQTEISNYKKSNGLCTINFQSSVGFLNYYLDQNGNVIDGSKEMNRQTLFETDYTYIQDIDKLKENGDYSSVSLSCPNCGAPIKNLGSKFCEFCGSGIKEINVYSWSFTDIREIDRKAKRHF